MIPKTQTATVAASLPGEVTSFTIQASGKAFRALIDGLYSDKVLAPVRELMTNAHDAHVAAGTTQTPFKVTVPTSMDPTFGVRDFGTGMTDAEVTGLYSTLFASSKEDTNTEVGMLGLGSKSPFGYTDSFTVRSYDGTEVRTYVAFLEQDVPKISMVDRSLSSEPRGLEVKFATKPVDRSDFVDAVRKVAIGFKVTPAFDADSTISIPVPRMSGQWWRLYASGDLGWSAANSVLQGCVTYPVPDRYASDIPYGMKMIVEVPIGSVDVAISREALSFDADTTRVVETAFHDAWSEIKTEIKSEYAKCVSDLERMAFVSKYDQSWRRALNLPVQLRVDLMPFGVTAEAQAKLIKDLTPGYFVEDSRKNLVTKFDYERLSNIEFILDDPKTVRRRTRLQRYCKWKNEVFVIPSTVDQHKAVARIKLLTGLTAASFKSVADLPDVPPSNRQSAPRDPLKVKRAAIDDGAIWVRKSRSTVRMPELKYVGRFTQPDGVDNETFLKALEGTDHSLVCLTEFEYDKLSPPAAQSLGSKYIEIFKSDIELAKSMQLWELLQQSLVNIGVDYHASRALIERARADYFKPTRQADQNSKNFLERFELVDYADIKVKVEAIVASYKVKYPRLVAVQRFDMAKYIQQQDNQEENQTS